MAEPTFTDKLGDLLLFGGRAAIDRHFGYEQQPAPADAALPVSEQTTTPSGAASPNVSTLADVARENRNAILIGVGGIVAAVVLFQALR